ncbi:hypothetical protein STXM2123_1706 [Streptomyces sp. F-3]|nr:hypothetical protein STXM2123_1706 [Streptomyces sp. F-3]
MVNHGALGGVQKRGVRSERRGTHQPVGAAVLLACLGVRQASGGGRGAHVVRRSWWMCGGLSRPTRGTVVAGTRGPTGEAVAEG